jgi:hypothetical protein
MKLRCFWLAAVLFAVVTGWFVQDGDDAPHVTPGVAHHGQFAARFSPRPPGATHDGARAAGIGSVRELRPVDLGR